MTEHDGYMLDAKVEHIKNFAAILSTVRLAKRQHVRVSVTERGLTFVAVDESKTLQAQANFRAEVFKAFSVTPTIGSDSHGFGVSLNGLVDVLQVFTAYDGEAELSLRWPDRHGRLVLATYTERGLPDRPMQNCTYAEVAPEERDTATNSGGAGDELHFRNERNAFMLPTSVLKEIIDDLEWPGAPIAITMSSEPSELGFSAQGSEVGDLRIEVDTRGGAKLTEFTCREAGTWRYRCRFMKAAMGMAGNLMGSGDGEQQTMTRVAISEGGVIKVVHLLHLSRALPHFGSGPGPGTQGASAATQRSTGFMVPVTFVAYPEEDREEDF